jgi:hypothetical protein
MGVNIMTDNYEEMWKTQLRICELNLAQLIRLYQWKQDGIQMDNDQDLIVDESSEVLNSLQRQKDKKKQDILSLDKRIRLEKERDKRNREMNASRNKKK